MSRKLIFSIFIALLLATAIPLLLWIWGLFDPVLLIKIALTSFVLAILFALFYWGFNEIKKEDKMKKENYLR